MQDSETILEARDLNQQAIMLAKTGNIEEAKEKLEKAIDIEPMLMDSYKNYGDFYLTDGKYQEAKNYYKKALLIEKNGAVYFQYGNACFLNDQPHEGLENYNLALSAGYDGDEMLFFMGMAYEHMNDDKMALRYIQKAINKNPSRPDYKVKKISALAELKTIKEKWGKKYPYAISNWENNWEDVNSFFQFPDEIRRIMYTTNIIEGLNRQYRKVTKTKSVFPSDTSLEKMLYLASRNITQKWTQRYRNWDQVLGQLIILYDERLTPYL